MERERIPDEAPESTVTATETGQPTQTELSVADQPDPNLQSILQEADRPDVSLVSEITKALKPGKHHSIGDD